MLSNRLFRSLWLANLASQIGSTMHDTGAVWLMSTLTSSATLIALMQTMSSLPLFLFALPAGALADIVDRRRMIVIAQVASLCVAIIISVTSGAHRISPVLLLSLTFFLALGNAFTLPAWQALIPTIVAKPDLSSALTLGSLGINVARGVGPVIGGLIVAASGSTAVFILNAISFLGIILVLLRAEKAPQIPVAHSEQMLGAIVAALRFTRYSPGIHAVLIRNAAFVFFGVAPMALLPLIVRSRHLGATDFGILMGAYGVGGVFSAIFLLPKLRALLSVDRLLLLATLVFASTVFLLSAVQNQIAMTSILFVGGSMWLVGMSTFSVAGQSLFPNWVRARSSAIQLVAVQAGLALGALTWGNITAHFNYATALQVAAIGIAVSAGLVWLLPVNSALQQDLTPSEHWREHDPSIHVGDGEGPVLVSIDYTVKTENAQAFEQAIRKLRAIRLRDGAFRWSLFHDVQESTHYRESFLVGSWGEHLRQHTRATAADKQIEDAVLNFQQEGLPPVKHFILK